MIERTEPPAALDVVVHVLQTNVSVAGTIVELGASTWAIHGSIPVDGEVILAEYPTYQQARSALDALSVMASPGGLMASPTTLQR